MPDYSQIPPIAPVFPKELRRSNVATPNPVYKLPLGPGKNEWTRDIRDSLMGSIQEDLIYYPQMDREEATTPKQYSGRVVRTPQWMYNMARKHGAYNGVPLATLLDQNPQFLRLMMQKLPQDSP